MAAASTSSLPFNAGAGATSINAGEASRDAERPLAEGSSGGGKLGGPVTGRVKSRGAGVGRITGAGPAGGRLTCGAGEGRATSGGVPDRGLGKVVAVGRGSPGVGAGRCLTLFLGVGVARSPSVGLR